MDIYVGNLSYEIKEEDLKKEFEAYGQVESVKIIQDNYTGRSKGFGFVEMPSEAEARAAITSLNGRELKGRAVKVNEALSKTDGRRGESGRGRRRTL
jgi:RNA recognition motif-containing protein